MSHHDCNRLADLEQSFNESENAFKLVVKNS